MRQHHETQFALEAGAAGHGKGTLAYRLDTFGPVYPGLGKTDIKRLVRADRGHDRTAR